MQNLMNEHLALSKTERSLWFDGAGLHVGSSRLIRHPITMWPKRTDNEVQYLDLVLQIATCTLLDKAQIRCFYDAAEISFRGDQVLANLKLATSKLINIPRAEYLSERLMRTDRLLNDGLNPHEVIKALGLCEYDLHKYDPEQPREPAGSGHESGRWRRPEGQDLASESNKASAVIPIVTCSQYISENCQGRILREFPS